jgi:hypothetical protein
VTTTIGWAPAPEGQVLMPGTCLTRDGDGQACVHGLIHFGPHQSTGLRAWLEAGRERALIRPYEVATADRLQAMETPLFAEFGFTPIVQQDLVHTEAGGLSFGWTVLVGPFFAPTEKVTRHLRLVCFTRP